MKMKHMTVKRVFLMCRVCNQLSGTVYDSENMKEIEEHYNKEHPFEWSVIQHKYGDKFPFYSRWIYRIRCNRVWGKIKRIGYVDCILFGLIFFVLFIVIVGLVVIVYMLIRSI